MTSSNTTANPAPLGLLGFGMTTVLLNLHNAGFYGLTSSILAMGLCFGGIGQLIAGVLEWQKGNTFGTTAFASYGCFWLSLVFLVVFPKIGWAEATPPNAMGFYLAVWGLYTGFMFIGTLRLSRALQLIFSTLTVLFFLLAASDFTGSETLKTIAGYEGLVCGLLAMYAGVAQVINEVYAKKIMPLV